MSQYDLDTLPEVSNENEVIKESRTLLQQGIERITPLFTSRYLQMVDAVGYSDDMLSHVPMNVFIDSFKDCELSKGDRKALKWIFKLAPEDLEVIRSEVSYLNINLPRLENGAEVYPAVMASVLILGNMVLSNTVRVGSTAYIAELAYREEDPFLKGIYTIIAGYVTLTNVATPIPSLPGLSNYISFNILELPIINTFKNWYWKHSNSDQRVDRESIRKEFKRMFSPARLTLNIEFVGSAMLLALEFLRAYNLDEVSPKTIRYINNMRKLRKYIDIQPN